MAPLLLYHERQQSALCGMHAVNSLLQGPCLGEWCVSVQTRPRQRTQGAPADGDAVQGPG